MKRKWKWVLVIMLIVCSVLSLIIIGRLLGLFDSSLARLRTPHGYVVDVYVPPGWHEVTVPIECTVTKNGETMFSEHIAHVSARDSWEIEFGFIKSGEEGELIAIIEQANPHIVIAIYDVKNRLSGQADYEVGEQLLKRLEQSMGQSFFWPGEFDEAEPRVYH